MATFKEALEYAANNPTSDFAKQFGAEVATGKHDAEAAQFGYDTTPIKQKFTPLLPQPEPAKRSLGEKILGFTGGEKIAQGLGQALANPAIAKQQEETQKQQMEIQGNLIKAIKTKRATGEDATKLEKALADLNIQISDTGNQTGELLNQKGLTTKQVIGDALQLGTTVASVGSFGKGFVAGGKEATLKNVLTNTGRQKALPSAIEGIASATSFGKGAIQGAKAGAISGGAFGTATGISQGLKKDKDFEGIVKEGLLTGVGGAVTGGIVGGVVGGVSGGLKGKQLKKENAHLEAITPNTKDLSPNEYTDFVRKGKISSKTSKNPDQYILSKNEIATANKYKSLLGRDPVKNTHNLIQEVAKKDEEVGMFLKKNNGIFSKGELKNKLSKSLDDFDDLLVSDDKLAKSKKSIVDNFVKSLKKNDMESLWTGRKEFDRKIESAFTGSPSLQKDIKKAFRNAVQDFIAERTPNTTYKDYMKDMTQLFNLAEITEQKAVKEKGVNAIQLWIKRNPTKASAVKWLGGTGVVGTLGYNALKN